MTAGLVRFARRGTTSLVRAGIAAAIVTSGLIGSMSQAGAASGKPIVLGAIGSYTEPGVYVDNPGAAPIEAWAKWVNAHGGINGHPVKMITMNDSGNQATAVSDVQTLINQDHIVALLSDQDAPLYLGFQSYLDAAKVPVLGGNIYTTKPWTTDPMFYPQGAIQPSSAQAPITFMKQKHLKNVGMIACSGAVQCTLEITVLKTLAKAAGLDFSYSAEPSNQAPTYTANCLAAKAAGVQILDLGIATSTEGLAIAQDCARQGFHPDWIVPGEALGGGYLNSAFNTTYNFSDTQPWFSTNATTKDFRTAMKKYTHINFSTVQEPLLATDSWASGLMFQKAVKLSGASGVPTSAQVLAGLKKFKNQTLTGFIGPVTFTNPAKKVGNCFFVNSIQNGKFVQLNGGKAVCNK